MRRTMRTHWHCKDQEIDPASLGILAETPVRHKSYNPRKQYGEPTKQEVISEIDKEEELEEAQKTDDDPDQARGLINQR